MIKEKSNSKVKKETISTKKKSTALKAKPVMLKKELIPSKSEPAVKKEPIIHTVVQKIQTAEGWRRSMVMKRAMRLKKTKQA